MEYGDSIYDVTNKLIKAVSEDVLVLPEYQNRYTAWAYAPENAPSFMRVKRYNYMITAIVSPDFGNKNEIIEYGIIEKDNQEMYL